jgi:hypothetical protein
MKKLSDMFATLEKPKLLLNWSPKSSVGTDGSEEVRWVQ